MNTSLIVYPDGTDQPGIKFECADGFVQRVVSAIANSNRMGCIPDARKVCEILNREAAAEAAAEEASILEVEATCENCGRKETPDNQVGLAKVAGLEDERINVCQECLRESNPYAR